jgi:hypothetical protein
MDINASNMNNQTHFTPLTNDKKQKLHASGGCFKCQKNGHISKYCPTKQNRSAKYGRLAPTQQACSSITDVAEEPKKGVKDLLKEVRSILNANNKQEFFNGLIAQDFV